MAINTSNAKNHLGLLLGCERVSNVKMEEELSKRVSEHLYKVLPAPIVEEVRTSIEKAIESRLSSSQIETTDPGFEVLVQSVLDELAPTNEELMSRVRDAGVAEAKQFSNLEWRFGQLLSEYFGRRWKNLPLQDHEDIIQITWLKIWKNRESWESQRSFKAWLLTIANRTAIDHYRGEVRHKADPLPLGVEEQTKEKKNLGAQLKAIKLILSIGTSVIRVLRGYQKPERAIVKCRFFPPQVLPKPLMEEFTRLIAGSRNAKPSYELAFAICTGLAEKPPTTTLKDVAAKCGTSIATCSRVCTRFQDNLNDSGGLHGPDEPDIPDDMNELGDIDG